MANSLSWETLNDFGDPFSVAESRCTADPTGRESIFDFSIPPDRVSPLHAESPAVKRPMDNCLGLNGFQPSIQAQHSSGKASSKSQTLKQDLASDPSAAKHLTDRRKIDSPLSEQQVKEAYCQLEINYRFKPRLTTAQLRALAVVVELPFDEVQAFYEQKQCKPPSYVSNSPQSDYLLGSRVSNPAKRHRGSDSSSSSVRADSACGTSRSHSSASLQTSERNAIPRSLSLRHQVRDSSHKPYECTWRDCQKSFASKSDWKRHEEVHCPQWYWACTFGSFSEGGVSSKIIPCTRKFKRDDHLREHLKKDHKCADLSKVEVGRQLLIPRNPFNKQCGFCGRIARGWLDRIDHIAEHFRNGKSISEWRDPWTEDVFEEGSDPSDGDDENDKGDSDGKHNRNWTSYNKQHTGKEPRDDKKKDSNMDTSGGGYQGSGNGYIRPGSFGIKYQASSRASETTEGSKRRDDAFVADNVDSLSSVWLKMCNLFKPMRKEKETAPASQEGINSASSETSRDIERQDEERIEFYCILCLKIVSMDPSLRNSDEAFCNCSEAAIKEHIISLTNLPRELPSRYEMEFAMESEHRIQKDYSYVDNSDGRSEMDKNHDLFIQPVGDKPEGKEGGRKRVIEQKDNEDQRFVALKKDMRQVLAAKEAEFELSYSMQRNLKITSSSEDSCKSGEYPYGGKGPRRSTPEVVAVSFEKAETHRRPPRVELPQKKSRTLMDPELNFSLP